MAQSLHLGPVTLDDTAAVLAPGGATSPELWTIVRYQLTAGLATAVRDDAGATLAIGGLWPSATAREAWLIVAPEAAKGLRKVLAGARLTLAAAPQDDPRPVVAVARSAAGARIARLLGFVPLGDGLWRWSGSDGRGGQGAVR